MYTRRYVGTPHLHRASPLTSSVIEAISRSPATAIAPCSIKRNHKITLLCVNNFQVNALMFVCDKLKIHVVNTLYSVNLLSNESFALSSACLFYSTIL